MKAVMLSVQQFYCGLIARGLKTTEIRKTLPKLKEPFKVYVYCTKSRKYRGPKFEAMDKALGGGMVIGEFICGGITPLGNVSTDNWEHLAGNVHEWKKKVVTETACLTEAELHAYAGGKFCYAWQIDKFTHYTEYKEISAFTGLRKTKFGLQPYRLTRAPQSWCYVEEVPNVA